MHRPDARAIVVLTGAKLGEMDTQFVLIVASIVASVFLGAISNWIYDQLRRKGFFPYRATMKAIIVIALASVPFALLITLSEIPIRDRTTLLALLQIPIPLWVVLVFAASASFLGYLLGRKEARKLNSLLEECKNRSSNLEEQLKGLERRLDRYRESGDFGPRSRIIRPPN
jgi:hypothetical protein